MSGNTPLHAAAHKGNTDICRLLIQNHADINAKNKNGITPLHVAALSGHIDICRLLIESGTNVDTTNKLGQTPLRLAADNGKIDVCKLLIENGANVNAKDNDGDTILHKAISKNYTDICKLLIEKDADVNAKDRDDVTPLYLAAGMNHIDICRLLIENHADVNVANKNGTTPLHIAIAKNHKNICCLLITKGANINTKSQDGNTPLHTAIIGRGVDYCAKGYELDICEILALAAKNTQIGFSTWAINAPNNRGQTPLHLAAFLGYEEICTCLLNNGARADIKDYIGFTPFDYAYINIIGLPHTRYPINKVDDIGSVGESFRMDYFSDDYRRIAAKLLNGTHSTFFLENKSYYCKDFYKFLFRGKNLGEHINNCSECKAKFTGYRNLVKAAKKLLPKLGFPITNINKSELVSYLEDSLCKGCLNKLKEGKKLDNICADCKAKLNHSVEYRKLNKAADKLISKNDLQNAHYFEVVNSLEKSLPEDCLNKLKKGEPVDKYDDCKATIDNHLKIEKEKEKEKEKKPKKKRKKNKKDNSKKGKLNPKNK